MILAVLFLISLSTNALDIECSNNTCTYDALLNPNQIGGTTEYESFSLPANANDLNIYTDTGEPPRSVRVDIDNVGTSGKNLTVNLSSTINQDAGDIFLTGDIFSTLNLNLDGAQGINGSSSSKLCSDNFKNGNYGTDAQTYFNQRRIDNPPLSADICDITDIEWVRDNKFACPSGYNEIGTSTTVIERIPFKRDCSGLTQFTRCVKRTYDVQCSSIVSASAETCCDQYAGGITRSAYMYPPLTGKSGSNFICDNTKCGDSVGSSVPYDGIFDTGNVFNFTERMSERTLRDLGNAGACSKAINDSAAGPEITYYDLNSDPVLSKSIVRLSATQVFLDLPTIIDTGNGGVEWIVEQIYEPNGFYTSPPNQNNYSNWPKAGEYKINNCLGLGSSSAFDMLCDINNSPAFTVYLRAIDSKGKLSNRVTINVSAGSGTPRTLYKKTRPGIDSQCGAWGPYWTMIRTPSTTCVYVGTNCTWDTPSRTMGTGQSDPNSLRYVFDSPDLSMNNFCKAASGLSTNPDSFTSAGDGITFPGSPTYCAPTYHNVGHVGVAVGSVYYGNTGIFAGCELNFDEALWTGLYYAQ
jgi:hypothetical protein